MPLNEIKLNESMKYKKSRYNNSYNTSTLTFLAHIKHIGASLPFCWINVDISHNNEPNVKNNADLESVFLEESKNEVTG